MILKKMIMIWKVNKIYLILAVLIMALCSITLNTYAADDEISVIEIKDYLDNPQKLMDLCNLKEKEFDNGDNPDYKWLSNDNGTISMNMENGVFDSFGVAGKEISAFGIKVGDGKETAYSKIRSYNSFQWCVDGGVSDEDTIIVLLYRDACYWISMQFEGDNIKWWGISNVDYHIEKAEKTDEEKSSGELSAFKNARKILELQELYGTVYGSEWKTALLDSIMFMETECYEGKISYNLIQCIIRHKTINKVIK